MFLDDTKIEPTSKQLIVEAIQNHRQKSKDAANLVKSLLLEGANLFWDNKDLSPQEMSDLYDEALGPTTAASLLQTSSTTIEFLTKLTGQEISIVPDGLKLEVDPKTYKVTVSGERVVEETKTEEIL